MALGALSAVKLRNYNPGKSVSHRWSELSNAALEKVANGELVVTKLVDTLCLGVDFRHDLR